jgi:23S rRNA (adenine2503-C2)-methyltransferase
MIDLKSMSLEEMTGLLKSMGQPAFRGKQVFTWLHKGVASFDEMTNLSKDLRERLRETCFITVPKVARKQVSQQDGTIKYLWELADGNCIESVLMRYHHGNTVCVSSQVGCRMGCAFCASTIAGKVRDLTPAELLDQVLFTQLDAGAEISNIVLMGIGEPMDNLDNVLKFLELVNHPEGLNIGMRHISLSTCGVLPGIRRLGDLGLQLTLSVSLHAPDSETRSKIMPVNRAYDVEKLFDACHGYFQKTGRRVSFEYAMIDGVNDHDWQADLIAKKLKGMPGHVNLIPLNDVVESPFKPSKRVAAFQKRLESHGVTATVRRSLGGDIDASCGQLRRKAMEERGDHPIMTRALGVTDIGLVRRENQDTYFIREQTATGHTICVVCDGMGGAAGGKVASQIATETFAAELEKLLTAEMSPEQLRNASAQATEKANEAIRAAAMETPEYQNMGTTLVAAVSYEGGAVVTNVGDSRAYHITADSITRVTKDHSLVERMVDRGDITAEEARRHPNRNLITRALGPDVEALCDGYICPMDTGDYLLLCTDGLVNTVTDQEILSEVLHSDGLEPCLRRLIELAKQQGAPDNVTAVLMRKL